MIETIFASLPDSFVPGAMSERRSYYFSLGEFKKTVYLSAEACTVADGRAVDNADCVCKTSEEFFCRIWNDDYRPGLGDFLSGTIKSNNPDALKDFLRAFGKPS